MGVEPFLVASTLAATMAQRLVRVLCKQCKQAYRPLAEELEELELNPDQVPPEGFYRPVGCDACRQTGYHGRTGIYELLMVGDEVRDLIVNRLDSVTIKKTAMRHGMRTLRDDGALKVIEGITSVAEVLAETQEDKR